MKVSQIHKHGGTDELCYEEVKRPVIGEGEVLIRVKAAGVNPADYKHRNGMFKDFITYEFPHVLGYDVAGTIDALGVGVRDLHLGDRVCALLDPMLAGGGYAQYVVTKAEYCAVLPEELNFQTASVLPCSSLTGIQLIEEGLKPQKGDRTLITGATGMVGRFALYAAKQRGAHVIAAVRSEYGDHARQLGADEIITLSTTPWRGKVFDGVIDTIGGTQVSAVASGVRTDGRILTIATTPLDYEILPVAPEFIAVHPDGKLLRKIVKAVARGDIDIPVVKQFPLGEAHLAHEYLEAGRVKGKIVLIVD